jgi:hypothetical protein
MPAVAKAMLENINLFIDVTKISNKYGSEGIAINCEYKKKNITPVTLICDQNKLPLSIANIDINKKDYNRNTSKHEIKNVQKTLNNIKLKAKEYINVNLIGDKAYITSEKFSIMDRKLQIITPKRKNQKSTCVGRICALRICARSS